MASKLQDNQTRISFIVDKELLSDFKAIAGKNDVSVSHLLRLLMKEYVQRGKGVTVKLE